MLAEYTNTTGNFTTVTQSILDKIPTATNSKMSYVYDRYLFHYIAEAGVVYMCMADEEFGRRVLALFGRAHCFILLFRVPTDRYPLPFWKTSRTASRAPTATADKRPLRMA